MSREPLLVEQLTLEILAIQRYLVRMRDSFGVITQWDAGEWLIVQFLSERGRCRLNTLLAEQHVSEKHAQRLLNKLVRAGLVSTDGAEPAIHAHYEVTPSGLAALERLRKAMKPGFMQFDDDFDRKNLQVALDILQNYRHRLECVKLDG